MASITPYKQKNGLTSYRITIRKQNHQEIYKTFDTEEDARIYAFYKERLLNNIENFEVPIEQRITLKQLFEIKIRDSSNLSSRSLLDLQNCFKILEPMFGGNKFIHDISYKDWEEVAKQIYSSDVYKGAKTESSKRKINPLTLRRHFANASSVFSHAISLGFNIENNPLKILKNYINPMLKDFKDDT